MGDGRFEINRRDLLKLGALPSVAGIALAACNAGEVTSDLQPPPASRPATRFLVDVHVHAGAPAGSEAITKEIYSPKDWALVRSTQPELFAKVMSNKQIDNSDLLLEKMDEKGVTHAII